MDSVSSSSLAVRERCSLGHELNRDCMAGFRQFCKLPALRDRSRMACICETCRIEGPVAQLGLAAEGTLMPDHGHCKNRWATPTVGCGEHSGVNVSPWRRTSEVEFAGLCMKLSRRCSPAALPAAALLCCRVAGLPRPCAIGVDVVMFVRRATFLSRSDCLASLHNQSRPQTSVGIHCLSR